MAIISLESLYFLVVTILCCHGFVVVVPTFGNRGAVTTTTTTSLNNIYDEWRSDAVVDTMDEDELKSFLRQIKSNIDNTVAKMPQHSDYLQKICQGA